jgi:hypothetical protein
MPRRLSLILLLAPLVVAQPRVFLVDLSQGREAAVGAADKILHEGPFSVMLKDRAPTSGDKHDYMSQAPYFWADPKSPNGLPYLRRDGERNPEINKITDHANMDRVSRDTRTLAIAYHFTHDENYAARAALLLRAWFIDTETRMNPNLRYAQAIPGVNDGRGIGIIESRGLAGVVDAAGLLAGSKSWTAEDEKSLEKWFADFLKWLQTSKNGIDESKATNNHGTFYDVQIADFALFTGPRELAVHTLQEAKTKRIAAQVQADGRQPRETERTRGLSYSVMNLDGMMQLALLAKGVDIDLWNFQTPDGRGIRKALDWLVPFVMGEAKWPYQQIDQFHPAEFIPLLERAAAAYHDDRYHAQAVRLEKK